MAKEGNVVRIRLLARVGLVAGALAGVGLLAACGGGGDDDGADDVLAGIGQNQSNATRTVELVEVVIEVKDNSFAPDTVTVKPGTKVVWKWTGTANPHSIQMAGTTSTEQSSGSFERVFDQSGSSFPYQCGVHTSAMTGRIVVE